MSVHRRARTVRGVLVATLAALTALSLTACTGGSATVKAAEVAQQSVIDSGAFVSADFAKSTQKNSNRIFAQVKTEGEMSVEQLTIVVTALGNATHDAGNCALTIVGVKNDRAESSVDLGPAARALGLNMYLDSNGDKLEMGCRVAQDFAGVNS